MSKVLEDPRVKMKVNVILSFLRSGMSLYGRLGKNGEVSVGHAPLRRWLVSRIFHF